MNDIPTLDVEVHTIRVNIKKRVRKGIMGWLFRLPPKFPSLGPLEPMQKEGLENLEAQLREAMEKNNEPE